MVDWTDEKVRRLFLVILSVHKIKVDADEVAAVFGEGATATAITNKLSKLRKEALNVNGGESVAAGGVAPNSARRRRGQKVQDGGITKKKAAVAKKIIMEEPHRYYEEE
jgi:hypothetical protein